MAIRKSVKKTPNTAQRFDSIEELFRSGFRQIDQRFEQVDRRLDFEVSELKRQIAEQGAALNQRFDQLANHVDGFIKLRETLDIKFKVVKEPMSRLEVRLARLEAARAS